MKKKILICALIAITVISATICASAEKVGDVINFTRYTDIVATIDGYDINCFNMNGYTYVVAEDLRQYGFSVEWNPAQREISISRESNGPIDSRYITPPVPENKLGTRFHDVLYTDIVAKMDGTVIPSYNINGQTIIPFNELSRYGDVTYNDKERRLRLSLYEPWVIFGSNEILHGDLSDYSGVYINSNGEKFDLRHNGTGGFEFLEDNGFLYMGQGSDFTRSSEGYYTWNVSYQSNNYSESYCVWFYPKGVQVYVYGTLIPTNTDVPRLYAGHDFKSPGYMISEIYHLGGVSLFE